MLYDLTTSVFKFNLYTVNRKGEAMRQRGRQARRRTSSSSLPLAIYSSAALPVVLALVTRIKDHWTLQLEVSVCDCSGVDRRGQLEIPSRSQLQLPLEGAPIAKTLAVLFSHV